MNHQVELEIGDWSGDGHSQVRHRHIISNLTREEILNSYNKGVKVLGFDLMEYCCDYEDSTIPLNFFSALVAHGMDISGFDIELDEEEVVFVDYESYSYIYLFIVKLGDPKFE